METFSKQPYEQFNIKGDFSRVIVSGEAVALGSSTATAVDVDGTDATDDIIVADSLQVTPQVDGLLVGVKGGTVAKSPYIITLKAVTDAGNKWELDLELAIYEE